MKNWEKAEEKVKELIKGKRTPGSGNKYILGDVRAPGKVVEVKQTDSDSMNLQYEWFEGLEELATEDEVALAIFFGLVGFVYYPVGGEDGKRWVTKKVSIRELPKQVQTVRQTWELDYLDSLRHW